MRPGIIVATALVLGPVAGVLLLIIFPCNLGSTTPYLCGHNAGLGLMIAIPLGIIAVSAAMYVVDSMLWERHAFLNHHQRGSAAWHFWIGALKAVGRMVAYTISGFCLFGALFSVLGVINPTEVKLADDNDPFGDPGTRIDALKILLAYVGVSVVSFWVAKKVKRSNPGAAA